MRRWIRIAISSLLGMSIEVATAQKVETAQGKISGGRDSNSSVTVFKGVPFAAPPIGDLRWRAPEPPSSWKGIRQATEFGSSCIQVKDGERLPWTKEFMVQNQISEDCLYLNIWTPNIDADAKLPVVIFIHGGGFTEGSGAVDVYHGGNLAAKGIVVVTINYRLGVLGFLAHPELTAESAKHASGNYGLLDQLAALRWVNANIRQFGGDPQRVTIWGQSAGAFSVSALVATPLAHGLFQRAQADSGLGITGLPILKLSAAEQKGVEFVEQHHVASIKELRALPAEALLPDPKASKSAVIRMGPNVDGWVLPDTPNNMSISGSDNHVPVITGYQAEDSALFTSNFSTLDDYHQMVQQRYGDMAGEYGKLYPVSAVEDVKTSIAESGQDRNRVSMFLWASARAESHKEPVYTYFFDRGIPWPQHPEFGAFHTGEIPYFFENLKYLDRPWETKDSTLADNASTYLVNFATKGDPNGVGLAKWPAVDPSQPVTMELNVPGGPMPLASKEKVEFWTKYFNSPISKNAPPF